MPVGWAPFGRALGEAEVSQIAVLAAALAIEQDVARLHVSMDEPMPVGGVERVRDLLEDGYRPCGIQGPPAPQERLQVPARHIAHRDEEPTVLLSRLVDRDHVRVVEAGGKP